MLNSIPLIQTKFLLVFGILAIFEMGEVLIRLSYAKSKSLFFSDKSIHEGLSVRNVTFNKL